MNPPLNATDSTVVASRALLGMVARSLSTVLETVTVPQFRVLVVLASTGPQRMGDLAEQIGVHPSTLTRTVERLETAGLILRAQVPGNRREVKVELTPEGATLVATVTDVRRAEIVKVIDGLTDDDRDQVRRGMEIFARAAGEPEPADLLEFGI
ncbi:MarR family transcriptional regulator [Demequina sp. SYSU T00039]|uniref:MarR family transcriptional regulator n=1 Tax=Demequina lignilytica TaxID=3051663 RepID=A0AAW7M210_9MICO|nr:MULTISPECIES: MarR family transcriptional regulator [unclassified Demequina]MDN4479256.1 MarR family transcriptional regulator [Demequina sp. SYSU T00039-1]MDN4487574.1 MarR family transcriptional regulator [Demequina sp. SYSU T00039]